MEESRIVYEVIGYVGTALVVLSFFMSSVYKLRVINTIGSLVSIVYGLLVNVYPTVLLNVCLALINIVFLWKHLSKKNQKIYNAKEVNANDPLVSFFLTEHKGEIEKFFPNFKNDGSEFDLARIIFCEDTFAGLLLGKKKNEDELEIKLDYATPAFRDFSVGKYLYEELKKNGIKKCKFMADVPGSLVYLKKIGFIENSGVMELNL
ncbi:MAG: hypothetical protein IK121_05735 [Lachnospiraceae bacterium]|nr:hypothetical protein [Lachnospiraceae bacterium]